MWGMATSLAYHTFVENKHPGAVLRLVHFQVTQVEWVNTTEGKWVMRAVAAALGLGG